MIEVGVGQFSEYDAMLPVGFNCWVRTRNDGFSKIPYRHVCSYATLKANAQTNYRCQDLGPLHGPEPSEVEVRCRGTSKLQA